MILKTTQFDDVYIFVPEVHKDTRGYFYESYNARFLKDKINSETCFEQAKLIRVITGKIYDVIVDIRKDSPDFGKWQGFTLSSDNNYQLWIPRGFAHGFLSLEENTQVIYKTDNFYNKEASISIMYNDIDLQIEWPVDDPVLSPNDKNGLKFSEL